MGIISSDKDDFEKLLNYFKIHPKCEKEIIELFKSRGKRCKITDCVYNTFRAVKRIRSLRC